MEAPVALITGITGQDGGYLAELLLGKGYIVHGLARAPARLDRARFSRFGELRGRLHLHVCDLRDGDTLENVLRVVRPNEIYNLAAQTHVQTSLEDPAYTTDVNAAGTVRLLEILVKLGHERHSRFFQACSSEIFGDARGVPQNEKTPLHPLNPYAASKRAAFEAAVHFRNATGVFASNGILFNHESPYRSPSFVTRKISLAVAASQRGEKTPLSLGNLDARRDWGHAGDYVRAMWLMLQREKPDDFVLATGETHSVREFVELAFGVIGSRIIWEGSGVRERGVDAASGQVLVEIDPAFFRAADAGMTLGDASKARAELGWRPEVGFENLVREMVMADIERMAAPSEAEARVASD
ncbi:GDP-mannose 4,6-dehydratase [Parvibaculum lavamentivorans]|uniref:GDP-mannose 4,6-dehydratase n=1 Tax=Parvibaculum lavamentivorans TaxID=256618 RepID=UPI0003145D2E|nr:GDP-mannose 4,6-dehydratase [Parvibaculum lavamentivorans]